MPTLLPSLNIEPLIKQLLAEIREFDAETSSVKNLLDPFATLLENFEFEFNGYDQWKESEMARQRQKNLMNKVGDLHQRIVGRLNGWTCHETGSGEPDLVGCLGNQRIIGEIKNKHNTMNGPTRQGVHQSLSAYLAEKRYKDHVAVVVHIIGPQAPLDRGWKPFKAKDSPVRDDIIEMNGRVFYAIATDSEGRQPTVDFQSYERLDRWRSWGAIDEMSNQFFAAAEKVFGREASDWIRRLVPQAVR